MADLTTRTEIPAEINNFYNKVLLDRATPSLLHNRFAQVKDLPRKAGTNVIKFRRYGVLAAATTPLTEGVTPAGKQLSVTDLTATVLQYGDYITVTDIVDMQSYDPVLTGVAEDILGDQVGLTLDQLCRDIITAGTTVQYASTATSRAEIAAAMKLNRAEVKEMVRTLRGNNAKPVMRMINPSTGYNTTPVGKSFIGIISEDTLFDIEDAIGWTPVEKYPNKSNVMEDEVGSVANVRFLMTTEGKTFAGTLVTTVHATLIFGTRAYAQTRISGEALKNIVKPLGAGEDALNQRATSGWKITYVARILNQGWIGRIEHAVST
jgi:N4-gp56 family major capsid protein